MNLDRAFPDHDEVWIEFVNGTNGSIDPVLEVKEVDERLVVTSTTYIYEYPLRDIKSWVKRKFWREDR